MPRTTRAQKDKRKAREDALKASETSTTGNNNNTTPPASNCAGGETRVSMAGESKRENVPESNVSEAVQDKRIAEKRMAEIRKERSDGGERGLGENKREKVNEINASTVVHEDTRMAENRRAEIHKERSDGGESGPGVKKQEKVNEISASTVVQENKRAEKSMAEIVKERSGGGEKRVEKSTAEIVKERSGGGEKRVEKSMAEIVKERSGGGERGPSRKPGEEETVSLRPSQLDSRQKQRDEHSSFGGNKGFRQDFNARNSSVSQSYEGENSTQGSQHGYGNRWRGRGGDEDDSRRIDALGRALSGILRHKAPELGLKVRSDGYVVVKDLLSLCTKTQARLPLHAHSVDDLKEAVKRDNKQRFGLHEENGQLLIRANQGHSLQTINAEELYNPILSAEEVPVCIHGTYKIHLESIRKEGLKRMRRNHVHFATGQFKEDGVISGMRGDCEVLIHMNVSKYLNDGMKLYRSENGVILAEGRNGVIPPEYFANIQQLGKKRNNNI